MLSVLVMRRETIPSLSSSHTLPSDSWLTTTTLPGADDKHAHAHDAPQSDDRHLLPERRSLLPRARHRYGPVMPTAVHDNAVTTSRPISPAPHGPHQRPA